MAMKGQYNDVRVFQPTYLLLVLQLRHIAIQSVVLEYNYFMLKNNFLQTSIILNKMAK